MLQNIRKYVIQNVIMCHRQVWHNGAMSCEHPQDTRSRKPGEHKSQLRSINRRITRWSNELVAAQQNGDDEQAKLAGIYLERAYADATGHLGVDNVFTTPPRTDTIADQLTASTIENMTDDELIHTIETTWNDPLAQEKLAAEAQRRKLSTNLKEL